MTDLTLADVDEINKFLAVAGGASTPALARPSQASDQVNAWCSRLPRTPSVPVCRSPTRPGERRRFSSAILPAWARKTPKITEVLPLLYQHGLSSGDFVPALGQFLGSSAGLSAAVIIRLTEQWKTEQRAFAERDLSGVDYGLPVGRRDPREHLLLSDPPPGDVCSR
jgi:putative transposase